MADKFVIPEDQENVTKFIRGGAGRVNLPDEPKTTATPADTIAVEVAKPARLAKPAKKAAHPWEELSEDATQAYNVDLPAVLHCKLKWLGNMTWDSSMRKIVIQALEAEAERRLKAMGINT